MTISDLKTQSVGIIGFGHEGQAFAQYLTAHNVRPVIYDHTPLANWTASQTQLLTQLGLTAITGEEYLKQALQTAYVIVRSPGVKFSKEQKTTIEKRGIILSSQTKWFFEHCPAKIIGITGTKGKGTTASLLAEMLQQSYRSGAIYLTGNIGKTAPVTFLDKLTKQDLVVFELSSFQLQDLEQSPNMAICLMVTSDHLDYHADETEYHAAKQAIAKYQTQDDILIYNADYPATKQIASLGLAQKFAISKSALKQLGAQIKSDSEQILVRLPNSELEISTQARQLLGSHNLENIAAASLAAALLGVNRSDIQISIQSFTGLPHRLQVVGEFEGVTVINDSISTNPDTAIAAINAIQQPLILLLGGGNKGLNYQNLIEILKNDSHLKAVVLIGETGQLLQSLLKKAGFSGHVIPPSSEFSVAVEQAVKLAVAGDTILLSPAATSFDMFANYAERGDKFIELIKSAYGKK